MPKLKIKRKPAQEAWQEAGTMLEENEGAEVKRAKIKIPDLTPKKKKAGKLIIRKGGGKVIKDEPTMKESVGYKKLRRKKTERKTESGVSTMMEKERIKKEKEMYQKFLKGMK